MSTYVGNKISEVDAQRLVGYPVAFHVASGLLWMQHNSLPLVRVTFSVGHATCLYSCSSQLCFNKLHTAALSHILSVKNVLPVKPMHLPSF